MLSLGCVRNASYSRAFCPSPLLLLALSIRYRIQGKTFTLNAVLVSFLEKLNCIVHFQGRRGGGGGWGWGGRAGSNCQLPFSRRDMFRHQRNIHEAENNKRQKDCPWKTRTYYRLENGSLGFIETLQKQ